MNVYAIVGLVGSIASIIGLLFLIPTCRNAIVKRIRLNNLKKNGGEKKFANTLTPRITSIDKGIPYYEKIQPIKPDNANYEEFFLLAPEKLKELFPNTFGWHTDYDKWLSNCEIDDVENGLGITGFNEIIEDCKDFISNSFIDCTDGCYYNNAQFGVLASYPFGRTADEKEYPILSLKFFKTDYYTSRVMGTVITKLREKGLLPKTNLTLKELNGIYRCFRTSLGISIVVIIPDTDEIIMTRRSSQSAFSDGKEWIYVSVTETLSETDYDAFIGNISISKWIERGLFEELGLTEEHYDKESVRIYDMFFENYFFQDNITASIQLKHGMNFAKVQDLKAKDKNMEIKEIFTINNSVSSVKKYISENKHTMREQTIFALHSYIERKIF